MYDTIAYQILFAILLNILILPVLYIFYDFLFSSKGYPALVNTDIISFLFTIPGVIAILLFVFVAIAISCIEKFGLLFITASYQNGERMSSFSALRQSVKKLRTEIPIVAIKSLCYAAVIALFFVSGLISYIIYSDSWFFIPLILLLALLCIISLYLLYIRWIFVDYLVLPPYSRGIYFIHF